MSWFDRRNATSNPRGILPSDLPGIGPAPSPERTFGNELQTTVDEIRQIVTDLGFAPYRVFSILIRWTGGAIGRGQATCVEEKEILPTPRVTETSGVQGELRSAGVVERGSVVLDRISAGYTEDELRSLFMLAPVGAEAPASGLRPGEQVFVELRVDARDGLTERRRFIVVGVPYRDQKNMQWKVRLQRQDVERARNGEPGGISGRM